MGLRTYTFKEGRLESPIIVQLEVSWKCNHKCIFCYNYWRHDQNTHTEPSFVKIKRIIRKISEAGVFSLVVTGGEPCLRQDFFKILDYARPKFQNVFVNTNASVLNLESLKAIKKSKAFLLISLPAPDQKTYFQMTRSRDFSRVTSNMRRLQKKGVPFGVNLVVTKLNFRRLFEVAALAKQVGAQAVSIGRFVEPIYMTPEQVSRLQLNATETNLLYEECLRVKQRLGIEVAVVSPFPFCAPKSPHSIFVGEYSCQAGLSVCAVSPTGEVRPCQNFALSFGNIFERSLKEIWLDIQREFKNLNTIECKQCAVESFCRAGCRAAAYHTYKKTDAPDPLCRRMSEIDLKKLSETCKKRMKSFTHANIEDRLRANGLDPFSIKLTINKKATFRKEDGALTVYLHPFTVQLNKTAKTIFFFLRRHQMTMLELIDKISKRYQIDPNLVLNDVRETLNSMGDIVLQAQ